jgi:hypothetical protein
MLRRYTAGGMKGGLGTASLRLGDVVVPGHFTANVSFGVDILRGANRRPRLSFQVDVENVTNNLYLVAHESEFTPGQYSIPRLVSLTARVRF